MGFRVDFYFIIYLDLIAFDKVVLVEKVDLVAWFASFRLFWVFIFVRSFFLNYFLVFWNCVGGLLMFVVGVLLICLNQYCLWFIRSILICISYWSSFLWSAMATCVAVLSIIIIKVTLIIILINACL